MSTTELGSNKRITSETWRINEDLDAVLPKPTIKQRMQDTTIFEEQQAIAPLIQFSKRQARHRQFRVLQEWQGIVNEVSGDIVYAKLTDKTDPTRPDEIVELPLFDFSPDQPLLTPGCVFYWTIGYERSPGGQVSRISEIRVRRMPKWTQNKINSIKAKAQAMLSKWIDDDESMSTPTE